MRKLVYTNPLGVSVTLFDDKYLITTLDGIDLPTVDLQEQKAPYQDGTTYLDALLEPRTIVVTGAIVNIQQLGSIFTNRAIILSALNPKNGPGVLTYTNDNSTYTTTCIIAQAQFPNKLATDPFQVFQIQIYCNDPYWYAGTGSSASMVIVTGGLTFPITFPITFGNYIGQSSTPAINAGDSVTPIIITVTGPSTNPRLTNQTTGEYIALNIVLNAGDILSINTKFGSKAIVYMPGSGGAQNAMSSLVQGSTFLNLAIGNNVLLFSDDIQGYSTCVVTWNNRYSGR
jgi:hypothetical protein